MRHFTDRMSKILSPTKCPRLGVGRSERGRRNSIEVRNTLLVFSISSLGTTPSPSIDYFVIQLQLPVYR